MFTPLLLSLSPVPSGSVSSTVSILNLFLAFFKLHSFLFSSCCFFLGGKITETFHNNATVLHLYSALLQGSLFGSSWFKNRADYSEATAVFCLSNHSRGMKSPLLSSLITSYRQGQMRFNCTTDVWKPISHVCIHLLFERVSFACMTEAETQLYTVCEGLADMCDQSRWAAVCVCVCLKCDSRWSGWGEAQPDTHKSSGWRQFTSSSSTWLNHEWGNFPLSWSVVYQRSSCVLHQQLQ